MIWDSAPWRAQLLKDSGTLKRAAASRRATERRSALIERNVFFSAYAMRRLDDAKKLSTSWAGSAVSCERYVSIGRLPDLMNWDKIEKFYDLTKAASCNMSARHLCDLIIHSYVFIERLNDSRSVEGFYITSDKKRTQALWFVSLDTLTSLIERTAQDDPATAVMMRNPETGDWNIWTGNEKPPGKWKAAT